MAARKELSVAFLEQVAGIFRLLGDTTRLEILQVLMAGPEPVGQIVEKTGKGQANVSKHLAALAAGGLIGRQRLGNQVIYRIEDPLVYGLCEQVCGSLEKRFQEQIAHGKSLLSQARSGQHQKTSRPSS